MSQSNSQVWFITGASAGFGLLLAQTLLRQGQRVIATARDLSKVNDLAAQYPEQARRHRLFRKAIHCELGWR
jgi:NADP-dependent 3-hydroxy acid dehydrogenase YdfG